MYIQCQYIILFIKNILTICLIIANPEIFAIVYTHGRLAQLALGASPFTV